MFKIKSVKLVKDVFHPVWHSKDLNPNWNTDRFKGLGSLEPWQVAEVLLNPEKRLLEQITLSDPGEVEKIVGHSEAKKALLLKRGIIK